MGETRPLSPTGRLDLRTAEGELTRAENVYEPAVDIYETAEAITLLVDIPGADPASVEVDFQDDRLRLRAPVPVHEGGTETILSREFYPGVYQREFVLQVPVSPDRIEAHLKDGVLRLVLPKAQGPQPRRIPVRLE